MNKNWIDNGISDDAELDWNPAPAFDTTEAVIGEANFLNTWWLELALLTARSVARVKLGGGTASGFLVGPNSFLTNRHVFENEDDARSATLQFNYRLTANLDEAEVDEWECDVDGGFVNDPSLDYAITKVKKKDGKSVGDTWGVLDPESGAVPEINRRINIIQHPNGRHQQVAFRDNQLVAAENSYIQYLTDTEYGSSGSPVFNDDFQLLALHSRRVRDPGTGEWYRNQGFALPKIVEHASDAGFTID